MLDAWTSTPAHQNLKPTKAIAHQNLKNTKAISDHSRTPKENANSLCSTKAHKSQSLLSKKKLKTTQNTKNYILIYNLRRRLPKQTTSPTERTFSSLNNIENIKRDFSRCYHQNLMLRSHIYVEKIVHLLFSLKQNTRGHYIGKVSNIPKKTINSMFPD